MGGILRKCFCSEDPSSSFKNNLDLEEDSEKKKKKKKERKHTHTHILVIDQAVFFNPVLPIRKSVFWQGLNVYLTKYLSD